MTAIPGGLCYELTSLKSVTIPSNVTTFGNAAFYGCTNLTSVTWKAKNSTAFNFGPQVTSFVFGDEVETIPASLCAGMTKLTTITIPSSVKSIGADAFLDCSNLEEVRINDVSAWCNIEFGSMTANPLLYANDLCLGSKSIKNLVKPTDSRHVRWSCFQSPHRSFRC